MRGSGTPKNINKIDRMRPAPFLPDRRRKDAPRCKPGGLNVRFDESFRRGRRAARRRSRGSGSPACFVVGDPLRPPPMPRILTYNIHSGRGVDGRLDLGRIAAVIAAEGPDIVALQEVDVGRRRTDGVDQAHALAQRLGMTASFQAALRVEEEQYGDAILTALPIRRVKAGTLPGYRLLPRLEPRGALWVSIETGAGAVQIINTHLGLVPREQQAQARELAGPRWLGCEARHGPLILVGDFNATRGASAYRILTSDLKDATKQAPRRGRMATFPSRSPVLRIDHVFVSDGVRVIDARVPATAHASTASDHRPLVVDFEIAPAPPAARV
jgi:endonuclease/exonuclease/phosphatase family metal-dependent hydrolase